MITKEKLQHHIDHLEHKVEKIKAECLEAYMQGSDKVWENLKKKKLKIKDQIEATKRKMQSL
jgi:hypothetical protein